MKTDEVRTGAEDAGRTTDSLQSPLAAAVRAPEETATEMAFARRPTRFRKIYRLSDR